MKNAELISIETIEEKRWWFSVDGEEYGVRLVGGIYTLLTTEGHPIKWDIGVLDQLLKQFEGMFAADRAEADRAEE